jgi:hypothetical protein
LAEQQQVRRIKTGPETWCSSPFMEAKKQIDRVKTRTTIAVTCVAVLLVLSFGSSRRS